MEAPTALYLPGSLPWPVTINRILRPSKTTHPANSRLLAESKSPSVSKTDALFSYSFQTTDRAGIESKETRMWDSPVGGEIVTWYIQEGAVLRDASQPVVMIQEPCTHAVQYAGQCAICGKDLSAVDYTGYSDTSRANIRMAHENGELTVSLEEASRLETQTTNRLLSTKKLSLIVDLDQTIIHATVDPTVGEWLEDPTNPNLAALDGTGKFRLGEGEPGEGDGCWYYVKMRPGLNGFLKSVSDIYEMHVYTMGTRAYASEVCKIIDPDGNFFGGRILSRDESGSMTRKSLQRLFPCDTSMVVIIDDRADVWDGSPNLLKVVPYEFFVGIGDINAAFLPKQRDPSARSKKPSKSPIPVEGSLDPLDASSGIPTTQELFDAAIISPSLSDAEASNAQAISEQILARPLAHQSLPVRPKSPDLAVEGDDILLDLHSQSTESSIEPVCEAVLKNNDRELDRLFRLLSAVHTQFFETIKSGTADVKHIVPELKRQVLKGCHIVFSGIIALGDRPEESDFWKMATEFGATCHHSISPTVTHLVAHPGGTAKVRAARKQGTIHMVWPWWLMESAAQWQRVDESEAGDIAFHEEDELVVDSQILLRVGNAVASSSSLDTPSTPTSVDEVGETDSRDGSVAGEDLDIAAVDWGDASKEVDDFLNETDDDTDHESPAGTNGDGAKKRVRAQTDSEDEGILSEDERIAARSKATARTIPTPTATGSPLSKRIKKSQLRKSGLHVVSSHNDSEATSSDSSSRPTTPISQPPRPSAPPPPPLAEDDAGGSQASSALDSDDDAFFASMAADVEAGWT